MSYPIVFGCGGVQFQTSELSPVVAVHRDGTIFMPRITPIMAACKTENDLKNKFRAL